ENFIYCCLYKEEGYYMRNNRIATTLQIVGTSIISIGIIFGSKMAIDNQDFGNYAFFLFVSYALGGAFIGTFFLGMSEIVEKLHNIELSVNTTPEEKNVKIGMKEMKNEMTSENLPLSEEKLSFIKRYLDKASIEYEAIRGTPFEGICLVI